MSLKLTNSEIEEKEVILQQEWRTYDDTINELCLTFLRLGIERAVSRLENSTFNANNIQIVEACIGLIKTILK